MARTLILSSLLTVTAFGCGMDWEMVRNHFEGVHDETGTVSIWDSFGDLDLGNGEKLPLYYNFGSSLINPSPYLGQGWYFPFLESSAVQQDENTFKVTMPNGKHYFFWRDQKNPKILNGQQNWKAEIREGSILAFAECGGKATFVKGRLVSFTTKGGKVLEFIQENGKTKEVRSSSSGTVLKVETDVKTGEVNGLTFGGTTVKLEQGQRPLVKSVQNQNLVTKITTALTKVTLPNGTTKPYDFAVNDRTQPTLKTLDHQYIWDPASGKILADGQWTYPITDLSKEGIARTNQEGQKESWFYDGLKGIGRFVFKDGKEVTDTVFTTGILTGELRRQEVKELGRISYKNYAYNESGKLIRTTYQVGDKTPQIIFEKKYYPNGFIKSIIKDDVVQAFYEDGRLHTVTRRNKPVWVIKRVKLKTVLENQEIK